MLGNYIPLLAMDKSSGCSTFTPITGDAVFLISIIIMAIRISLWFQFSFPDDLYAQQLPLFVKYIKGSYPFLLGLSCLFINLIFIFSITVGTQHHISFKCHSTVVRHLHNLQRDHPEKSGTLLAPYSQELGWSFDYQVSYV